MSLLKLLFDLPEAGGETNFTAEEQEELMAFEHNLDEHGLGENFALPPTGVQFEFLKGTEVAASRDPAPVNLMNGAMTNGVENGHTFGSSMIQNSTQDVALLNQEPASHEMKDVSQKTLEPANTPVITASEPAPVPVPEITPSLLPAVGSIRAIAPNKKYDVSSKHQGSGKAVWIKV